MAAILTSTGIQFSDTTALNSRRDIFPTSTAWVVYQTAAPTGWTKVVTHNDKALRVVSGTGGGSDGSISFTSAFPGTAKPISATSPITGTVGPHILTTPQLPSHTHANGGHIGLSFGGGDVGVGGGWTRSFPGVGANGGNQAHAHPFSGGSASFSTSMNLAVQYVDVIFASFN